MRAAALFGPILHSRSAFSEPWNLQTLLTDSTPWELFAGHHANGDDDEVQSAFKGGHLDNSKVGIWTEVHKQIRMPHRARPMTGLLLFVGLNAALVSTIEPVYDFVCFLPYWERRLQLFFEEMRQWLISTVLSSYHQATY